jgi:hypothetical protein
VLLAGAVVLAVISLPMHIGAQDDSPEFSLRARPNLAFAPAEISFNGRLRGGADNNEGLYCASAEWDWDDGTKSESIFDCEPYETETSKIRRRFSRRHSYDRGGRYEVKLLLKQRGEVIDIARVAIVIQGR